MIFEKADHSSSADLETDYNKIGERYQKSKPILKVR